MDIITDYDRFQKELLLWKKQIDFVREDVSFQKFLIGILNKYSLNPLLQGVSFNIEFFIRKEDSSIFVMVTPKERLSYEQILQLSEQYPEKAFANASTISLVFSEIMEAKTHVTVTFSASIPEEEKELLRQIGKIIPQTYETLYCGG